MASLAEVTYETDRMATGDSSVVFTEIGVNEPLGQA